MTETPSTEKILTLLHASERGPDAPFVPHELSETDIAICVMNSEGPEWTKYAWLLQNYWSEWPHEGDPRPELFEPAGTTEAHLLRCLFNACAEDWRKYAWLLQWYWPQKYGGRLNARPNEIRVIGRPPEKSS